MSWPEDYDDPEEAFDDEHEMQMECSYCHGTGENAVSVDGCLLSMDCPECGGTGWY